VDEIRLAELEQLVTEKRGELDHANELVRSFPGDYTIAAAQKRNEFDDAVRELAQARVEFEQQKRERDESARTDTAAASRLTARATVWVAVVTAVVGAAVAVATFWRK